MFLCPSALGGGCCSYGQTCGSSRKCLWTSTAGPTSVVGEIPAGCTTSQIACPASMGAGCCALSQSCTSADGSAQCAAATAPVPTGSGVSAVARDRGGLSAGGKAGVAVGAVVGSGLVVGAVTWVCLRRRRRRRRRRRGSDEGSGTGTGTRTGGGSVDGPAMRMAGGRGGWRTEGVHGSGGGRAGETSESHSDVVSHGGRLRGLTQDYFGPDAVAGPFTEAGHGTSSPHAASSGRNRAVPTEPQSPDDITAAVEIDSRSREPTVDGSGNGGLSVPAVRPQQVSDTIERRFELYGSELSPPSDPVSPFTPQSSGAETVTPADQHTNPHVA